MSAVDGGPWRGCSTESWLARISYWPTPWIELFRASTEDFPALPASPFVGGGQVESSVDSLRSGSSESGGSL